MDHFPIEIFLCLITTMSVTTFVQFIQTNRFYNSLFKDGFIDLCKYLSYDKLAWIRSHGSQIAKRIARDELLKRYPQLNLLTDKTIRVAIKRYKENEVECILEYGPIELWDVSNVTDLSYLFESMSTFNERIGNWDVSQVLLMYNMFDKATHFNQPIGDWDVSNVTNMM